MDALNNVLDTISNVLYTYIVIALLMAAGVYFTIRTRAVQVRMFGHMWTTIMKSRDSEGKGISSFQAFAIGIASRVGTGNIVGVAIALALGGPGAIFWMWVVALLGMATAFVEATMAQMFKIRGSDGSFRGGPAYYISRGLGKPKWGVVFACLLIFTFGFAFNTVQANTIAGVFLPAFGLPTWVTSILLVILCAPIILGGVRPVARVAEWMAPIMAIVYIAIAVIIIAMNATAIPTVLQMIFSSAFGIGAAAGGFVGGISAAMMNGVKRGLFSNEAGMGSAPNAAATATVAHPVQQGLIQAMGVFVDTMMVCSATAFICLVSGVYDPGVTTKTQALTLTQESILSQMGSWMSIPVTLISFVFAYSSILGNFAYAEINLDFIRGIGKSTMPLRILVVIAVALGAVAEFTVVWTLADIAMGCMALLNLTAIMLMGGWVYAAMRDYETQWANVRAGKTKILHFHGVSNPELPKDLPDSVWVEDYGVVPTAD